MNIISIIGRPNVGKSSLFNLLSKSRDALVSDMPGVTRDRHYCKVKINDEFFLIIDTGGVDEDSNKEGINNKILEQTNYAIDESDIIFFMVDARFGCHPSDESIAKLLRKKNKSVILVINKCEGLDLNIVKNNFYNLGFSKQVCISASHNEGINLLNEILFEFPSNVLEDLDNSVEEIKISVLGKPNVGKSTLINSIIGEERFISFDHPGTTRDSVSTHFEYKDFKISIIDNAGIRKKGKVIEKIEKFSILKSILSIEKSNLSILVLDAQEGLTSQDLQIFGYILKAGKPLVIGVNKWDLLDSYAKDELKKSISKKINFFSNFEIFYISALKKVGIFKLLDAGIDSLKSSLKKIKTPILNNFLKDTLQSHLPPIYQGIRPKLKYIHQGDTAPPTFIIHGNHLVGLKNDYIKFIESAIIKVFKLKGTPVRIQFKETENPYEPKIKKSKKIGLVTRRKEINLKRKKLKKQS
jgi:GTP-binding protein